MGVNFIHTIDKEKFRTFHIKSNNIEIRSSSDTNDIATKLLESFLNKYEQEENILKNGSNYSFESVDIVLINHNYDFYCLNCLGYCESIMPKEGKNILKYHSGEKSLKAANAIYFHLKALQVKNESCSNDPEKPYTVKKVIPEVCGYAMNLVRSYSKNIHKHYRGKFSEDIKALAMKVINYEKKEMIPLTNRQNEDCETLKYCHILLGKILQG